MSRKDQRTDHDERAELDEAGPSDFFPNSGSGMSKEVKIGMAVIVVLLTVFGVLLVNRMRRSDQTAAATDSATKAGAAEADKADKASKEAAFGKAPSPSTATVVAAKAGPGPSASPPALPRWSLTADNSRMKDTTADGRAESPPPSFMPRADVAAANDRSSRFPGAAPPAPEPAPQPWQSGQSRTAISVGGQQPFDPFPRAPSTTANDSPAGGVGSAAGSSGGVAAAPSPAASYANRYSMSSGAAASSAGVGNPLREPSGAVTVGDRPAPLPSASTFAASGPAPAAYRTGAEPQPLAAQPAAPVAAYARSDAVPLKPSGAAPRPDGTYLVQPNDNFWRISEKLYGSGAYFRALAEHNHKKIPDEDRLAVGDVILAPPAAELERGYPSLCPKPEHRILGQDRPALSNASLRPGARVYVVQEGDNLFNIAKYELKSPTRWPEIYELNRHLLGDQVDRLTPGMKLTLPDAQEPGGVLTRQPGATLRR